MAQRCLSAQGSLMSPTYNLAILAPDFGVNQKCLISEGAEAAIYYSAWL